MYEQGGHIRLGKRVGKRFVTSGAQPVAVVDTLLAVAVIWRLPTSTPNNLQA